MSDKPDYKTTLNLPRTEFAMQANLVQREPERLARWESANIYGQIQQSRAGQPRFVLHDGPPFANGDVHIGTAFNKILKDLVIKSKTLRGFQAPYVPGWDCHGLPIESKVTQELRAAGQTDVDAAGLRSACDAYARRYIDLQRRQFRRLGVFGDWDNPYLTLDRRYEAEELRLFADIVEKGFVYRGKKPVYWSIPFRTALAEAEVEYKDHVSQSVYVRFKLKGEPNTSVLIWTTTPWTLPANLAVAFNPGLHYSYVFTRGETFLVANALLGVLNDKCGWEGYQILRTADPEELASLEYEHPFCARTGRLFPAEFVTADAGTGFVHIAPGHGMDDYQLGLRVGLPIYCPVTDEGLLAPTADLPREQQLPESLVGKSVLEKSNRSEANDAVLALLGEKAALVHREDYVHSYPHCWRSKTPIVFRAVDQWFIRIDKGGLDLENHPEFTDSGHLLENVAAVGVSDVDPKEVTPAAFASANLTGLRKLALNAIERDVKWIPDWGKSRITGAVITRPDWCISRQRTWGVPIPAFYDAAGEPILNAEIVRNVAALVEEHGSNVWFATPAAELWSRCRPKNWTGPEAAARGQDTLDVWIDSGSSSRAVLRARPELQQADGGWVADMYLEGSDQHRGWFQSSLLLSLAGNGAPPFRTVLTHGFMVRASKVDPKQKEKVSKSAQGTYEKPETADRYVSQFGADVVRLWVASQDYRGDVWVGDDRVQKVAETYRLIRNTLRYQLSNLYDFDPARHAVPFERMTGLDRWVLGRFAELSAAVATAYENYEFHVVYQRLSQFVSVELSAMYHDVVKDRLYTDPAGSPRRRATQTALHRMATHLCQMLSPMLAFTAEEAWEFLPGIPTPSVHLSVWNPTPDARPAEEVAAWETLFRLREQALPELEKARQAKAIGKALEARVTLRLPAADAELASAHRADLQELLNVSQLAVEVHPEGFAAVVERARGTKCERCWHWEEDVGQHAAHPTLCGRCVTAVTIA